MLTAKLDKYRYDMQQRLPAGIELAMGGMRFKHSAAKV